ncbi:MAG: DNA-directed RNA polymerase subunit omega [Fusobacteriota bacterium]
MKREIRYEDLIKKIPNKYSLCIVAGKRGRDLSLDEDLKPLTNNKLDDTIVKTVFREIVEDKIGLEDEEE